MNKSIVIQIRNLFANYGNTKVLNGINCDIRQGELIGILGKSGTGKTTLLNIIAGFIKAEGEIKVSGNIGYCFQQHSLFDWMTVAENIEFGLQNMSEYEKGIAVSDLLHKIDLIDASNKYPFELSGGQMQRVSLARALANKPSIILLDEPFSSLDILTRDLMIEWFLQFIRNYPVTVIMVTHYLDEALLFSDRILILKNQKIEHDFKVELKKPRTLELKFKKKFRKNKKILLATLKN